jgi:hypothetical protein
MKKARVGQSQVRLAGRQHERWRMTMSQLHVWEGHPHRCFVRAMPPACVDIGRILDTPSLHVLASEAL